ILYGRIWPTLVSLVAQFIILVVSIILVYMTVKATIYPNAFLENNIIFNFFKNLFVNKSAKNFVIVISLALLLGILAIAVNITRIQFLLAKQYTYSFFKDQLVLVLTYLAATFIWFIKVFTIKVVDLGIVNHKIEYFYLFEILFGLILTSLYLAITFKKKLQPNGASINSLIFSLFQMLLWVSLLVVGLHSNIQLVNALNIFFISAMSLTMLVVYLKKTNSITITEMIFLITFLIAMVLSMFIFGINQYLLSKSNNIFYIINSSLYITQIFLVLNVVIAVSFFMFSAIKLIVILLKISKTKEKLKETTYEKK
ncbi:MSC_0624 family F1-like ATPase-associated membrane protein, partial [Metamycoplasma hyosynoviae]